MAQRSLPSWLPSLVSSKLIRRSGSPPCRVLKCPIPLEYGWTRFVLTHNTNLPPLRANTLLVASSKAPSSLVTVTGMEDGESGTKYAPDLSSKCEIQIKLSRKWQVEAQCFNSNKNMLTTQMAVYSLTLGPGKHGLVHPQNLFFILASTTYCLGKAGSSSTTVNATFLRMFVSQRCSFRFVYSATACISSELSVQ